MSDETERTRPVAFVTGATSGIGWAYARHLAFLGYDLVLQGTKAELLPQGEALQAEFGVAVRSLQRRIGTPSDVEDLIGSLGDLKVDLMVCNAGFALNKSFADTGPDETLAMLSLHVNLNVRLAAWWLPSVSAGKKGELIVVSSDAASLILEDDTLYCATKAFLRHFFKVLQHDIGRKNKNVRILVVCPGPTLTNLPVSLGIETQSDGAHFFMKTRWATPEDIVEKSISALRTSKKVVLYSDQIGFVMSMVGDWLRTLSRLLFVKKVQE